MTFLGFSRWGLGSCAALVLLAACAGGIQAPLAPVGRLADARFNTTGTPPGARVVGGSLNPPPSWLSPEAEITKALLYVSHLDGNSVSIFSYPKGKVIGTLTDDLASPDGICVDNKRNIWVVNNSYGADIAVEYKRGDKTHVAALHDPGLGHHIACSVDPTTGNLAVTTYGVNSGGGGLVSVYAHAKGKPKHYTDSKIAHFYYCGYDDKGNLYADGTDAATSVFYFAEVAKGAKTFKNITLKGGHIYFPGEVQWDGKYVAVGDQTVGGARVSAIYQTTGAGGKIVGKTPLDDPTDGSSEDVAAFWIDGKTVVGTNTYGNDVPYFKYPAGGKPTKRLTDLGYSIGVAISK